MLHIFPTLGFIQFPTITSTTSGTSLLPRTPTVARRIAPSSSGRAPAPAPAPRIHRHAPIPPLWFRRGSRTARLARIPPPAYGAARARWRTRARITAGPPGTPTETATATETARGGSSCAVARAGPFRSSVGRAGPAAGITTGAGRAVSSRSTWPSRSTVSTGSGTIVVSVPWSTPTPTSTRRTVPSSTAISTSIPSSLRCTTRVV